MSAPPRRSCSCNSRSAAVRSRNWSGAGGRRRPLPGTAVAGSRARPPSDSNVRGSSQVRSSTRSSRSGRSPIRPAASVRPSRSRSRSSLISSSNASRSPASAAGPRRASSGFRPRPGHRWPGAPSRAAARPPRAARPGPRGRGGSARTRARRLRRPSGAFAGPGVGAAQSCPSACVSAPMESCFRAEGRAVLCASGL